jgi:hypothetical protein
MDENRLRRAPLAGCCFACNCFRRGAADLVGLLVPSGTFVGGGDPAISIAEAS